jgi:hypothetical protein
MKREAITHTKMKRICRRLDLPSWQGVGLLESLWQLTARETPRGNIGKLSDEDIALGIDYRGDEKKMLNALVDSGWLDRDSVERLIVHDWAEHADDAVHMRIARLREFFVGGHPPKLSRLPSEDRKLAQAFYAENAQTPDPCAGTPHAKPPSVRTASAQNTDPCALPEPRQSPVPPEPLSRKDSGGLKGPSAARGPTVVAPRKPSSEQNGPSPATSPPLGALRNGFEEFREQYPTSRNGTYIESACRAYTSRISGVAGEHERLMAGLKRHKASAEWRRYFSERKPHLVCSMEKFISEGRYLDHPPAAEEEPDDGYAARNDAWEEEKRQEKLATERLRKELSVEDEITHHCAN